MTPTGRRDRAHARVLWECLQATGADLTNIGTFQEFQRAPADAQARALEHAILDLRADYEQAVDELEEVAVGRPR